MSQPLSRSDTGQGVPGGLLFEERAALRGWLVQVFREIHRLTREIETRAPSLQPAEPIF
jgi:hypothetical protein